MLIHGLEFGLIACLDAWEKWIAFPFLDPSGMKVLSITLHVP